MAHDAEHAEMRAGARYCIGRSAMTRRLIRKARCTKMPRRNKLREKRLAAYFAEYMLLRDLSARPLARYHYH